MTGSPLANSTRRRPEGAGVAKPAAGLACVASAVRINRRAALGGVLAGGIVACAPFFSSDARAEGADAAGSAAPAPVTLAAFGDSLTAGYGLAAEEGFTPVLERWLNANGAGPVRVINAGVSGDTTSGGLARLDWSIGDEVDGVILELGANDALRGIDPSIARDNLDAMLARLSERGLPTLLTGMYAPRNWGDEYVEAFEGMYPALAEKHGVPLYPFFLEGVAGDPALNQPDGIHPNAEGVERLVAAIGPAIRDLVLAVREQREDAS